MIGSLHGVLAEKTPPRILLEVQGVGYEVEVPMSTFLSLPPVGSNVRLRVHHVLREDASLLFGFATEDEREFFRALIKVTGVGPKMAAAILSGTSADAFGRAIVAQDAAALTKVPGVGRKTAERLVVEMRDHFAGASFKGSMRKVALNPRDEAQQALLALGYKPPEAVRMLDAIEGSGHSTEDLLRAALQGAVAR
jgi:holliday junction DNA helicase RuvA